MGGEASKLPRPRLSMPHSLGIAVAVVVLALVAVGVAVVIMQSHKLPHDQKLSADIPKQLFMTGPWSEDALPDPIQTSIESWKRHGPPGLRIRWFDEPAREAWVAKHFPQYLDAYRSLVPGSYQADLWRVLVLFANGGVYSDAGTLLQAPVWAVLQGCSLVFCRDLNPVDVAPGVLAAVQGHPVMLAVAKRIAANTRTQHYGKNPLSPTGPVVFGSVFRHWFTKHPTSHQRQRHPAVTPAGHWVHGKHGQTTVLFFTGKQVFDTTSRGPLRRLLWTTKVPHYRKVMYEMRGVKSYGELWSERAVYRDITPPACSVPSLLFLTGPFHVHALPHSVIQNMLAWRRNGPPDLQIFWFDDNACERWVRTHFPQYLAEYQVLVPGAFKADLWRLLVLFKYGGMYADVGTRLDEPLWPMIRDAPLVLCTDSDARDIWQGVIGAKPRHPVVLAMVEHVVSNIRQRRYNHNPLAVTGPKAVAIAARHAFGSTARSMLSVSGEWLGGHHANLALVLHCQPRQFEIRSAADQKVVTLTKTKAYYHAMYAARRQTGYHDLWFARGIYADNKRAQSAIPHRLFMTGPFRREAMPQSLAANITAWKQFGPVDLDVQWFDDDAAQAWIARNYPQFLSEYDVLVPGAFKADLWRLLVLYKHGGVYADAGTSPLAPIWPLLHEASLVFCRDMKFDGGHKDIWQGVLAAVPGHPVVWAMVTHVVANIDNRYYGSHCLSVTGPKVVSVAAKNILRGSHDHLLTESEEWVSGDHGDVVVWEFSPGAIHTSDGQFIIRTKVPRYNDIMYKNRGVSHYGLLWAQRAIYKDDTPFGNGDNQTRHPTSASCQVDVTGGDGEDEVATKVRLCGLPTTLGIALDCTSFDEFTVCKHMVDVAALSSLPEDQRRQISTVVVFQFPDIVGKTRDALPNVTRAIVWNTEQTTNQKHVAVFRDQWKAMFDAFKSSLALELWDYSEYNAGVLERELGDAGALVPVFVCPTAHADDVRELRKLRDATAREFDFVCVGSKSAHRDAILEAVQAQGHTVKTVHAVRGRDRDAIVASGRALLNLHQNDTFRVFESARCSRWLAAGMPVVSEACINDNERIAAGAYLLHADVCAAAETQKKDTAVQATSLAQ